MKVPPYMKASTPDMPYGPDFDWNTITSFNVLQWEAHYLKIKYSMIHPLFNVILSTKMPDKNKRETIKSLRWSRGVDSSEILQNFDTLILAVIEGK